MSFSWDPTGDDAPSGSHVPALPPSSGARSGDLVVRGGVNGITWSLEELDAAAASIQAVAEAMCRISAAVGSVEADLWGLPVAAVVAASAARAACATSQLAAGRLATSLLDCAGDVRTARTVYQASEDRAAAAVNAGRLVETSTLRSALAGGVLLGPVGISGWLGSLLVRGEKDGYRNVVEAELNTLPQVVDPTVGGLLGGHLDELLRATGHPAGAASFLAVLAVALGRRAGLSTAGDLEVRQIGARTVTGANPLTVASLTDHVAEAQSASDPGNGAAPRSAVIVRRYDGGAAPVWEVDIPGTNDWGLADSPGLFDLEGNGEAITAADAGGRTARPTQVGALVVAALAGAGAPRGARVVLAGHSQGGIHAAALAADPRFRAQYDVRQVVTAGAPVAAFDVPHTTSMLSLEHRDDVVPALDGRPNPDARNRVTVTGSSLPPALQPSAPAPVAPATPARTPSPAAAPTAPGFSTVRPVASSTPAAAGPGPGIDPLARIGAAHQLTTYREIAQRTDASTDPSVTAQRTSMQDLTRDVTRQTVWVFEGRDQPRVTTAAAGGPALSPGRTAGDGAAPEARATRSGGRPPR